jgi:hypothetical protein
MSDKFDWNGWEFGELEVLIGKEKTRGEGRRLKIYEQWHWAMATVEVEGHENCQGPDCECNKEDEAKST